VNAYDDAAVGSSSKITSASGGCVSVAAADLEEEYLSTSPGGAEAVEADLVDRHDKE
jgi:hypothetical protein